MGRKLFGEMAAHWPTSTEVFAPPMNEIPKVVFSTTMKHADWERTRVVSGDVGEEIARPDGNPARTSSCTAVPRSCSRCRNSI
jgi:dihydrofolate reductase